MIEIVYHSNDHESELTIKVKCFHQPKLPDNSKDIVKPYR